MTNIIGTVRCSIPHPTRRSIQSIQYILCYIHLWRFIHFWNELMFVSRLSLKNAALQCLTFGIVQQRGSRFCMFLLLNFAEGWHHSIRFHCFAINCLKGRWQKFQPPLLRNRVLKFGKNTFCIYLGFLSPKKDGWPCSVSSFSMWKCEAVFLQAAALLSKQTLTFDTACTCAKTSSLSCK